MRKTKATDNKIDTGIPDTKSYQTDLKIIITIFNKIKNEILLY